MNAPDICLRRAVYTGLRYAGIVDNCEWIPANAAISDLDLIGDRYPKLNIYHSEEIHDFRISLYVPILIVYREKVEGTEHGYMHAIFASDVLPFSKNDKYAIYGVIIGWEDLLLSTL